MSFSYEEIFEVPCTMNRSDSLHKVSMVMWNVCLHGKTSSPTNSIAGGRDLSKPISM